MYKIIALLIVTISVFPRASIGDNMSLKFGPGIVDGEMNYHTKRLSLRGEHELAGSVLWAWEAGGFVDTLGNGHRGSVTSRVQLGVTPGPETGLYGKFFFGPGAISKPDSQLGGQFPQFCTDFGVGIRDEHSFIAIGVEHISSAGIFTPNAGRNYVTTEAGLRF